MLSNLKTKFLNASHGFYIALIMFCILAMGFVLTKTLSLYFTKAIAAPVSCVLIMLIGFYLCQLFVKIIGNQLACRKDIARVIDYLTSTNCAIENRQRAMNIFGDFLKENPNPTNGELNKVKSILHNIVDETDAASMDMKISKFKQDNMAGAK